MAMRRIVLPAVLLMAAAGAPVPAQPAPHAATSERGPAAAVAVVKHYYAAIAARDYAAAWAQWGEDGQPGRTFAAFRAGFAKTRSVTVSVAGPVEGDAACGSLYVTVPVVVRAVWTNGTRHWYAGHYVLRRVNDVDGATPAQLRWHIDSATLRERR